MLYEVITPCMRGLVTLNRWCIDGLSATRITSYNVCYTKLLRALDPAVFIDDDGTAYLYWNQMSMGVLKNNMRELDGPAFKLDIGAKNFMEASWMHKRRITSYNVCYTKLLRNIWATFAQNPTTTHHITLKAVDSVKTTNNTVTTFASYNFV